MPSAPNNSTKPGGHRSAGKSSGTSSGHQNNNNMANIIGWISAGLGVATNLFNNPGVNCWLTYMRDPEARAQCLQNSQTPPEAPPKQGIDPMTVVTYAGLGLVAYMILTKKKRRR